jgi:hypothetical protein
LWKGRNKVIKSGIMIMSLILFAAIIGLAMPEQSGACGTDCSNAPTVALIKERCTVCHNTDRIYAAKKDEAGWTGTVDTMIGKGAKLNPAERQAVIVTLVTGICDACKNGTGQ